VTKERAAGRRAKGGDDGETFELQDFGLFAGVSGHEIRRLLREYPVKQFPAREILFRAEDDMRDLYLLLNGAVKTFVHSPQGHMQVDQVFHRGSVFGRLLYGSDDVPRVWAQAIDSVVLISLGEAELTSIMREFPVVSLNIFRQIVEQERRHSRRLQAIFHSQGIERLVHILLYLGDLQASESPSPSRFVLAGFGHDHLADMTGMPPITISALMKQLRRRGVVSGARKLIGVDRREAERFLQAQD
jgi:CRP-like cAMP-binding protein